MNAQIQEPVSIGVAGLGGYAASVCHLVESCMRETPASVQLTAICEPDLDLHAEIADQFRDRGIKVLPDLEALLDEPIEAVWLPVPIHLHRPFTEKALSAGKAVLCEKPAAGCIDDLDAMIRARDQAGRIVAVGYQDIFDPSNLDLKQRLGDGAIGDIQSATLVACWPRSDLYYGRNDWAGRVQLEGRWVMDSPANNALAHYFNLALFLLGPSNQASAQPVTVEAEHYRVNPIENYDTICLRTQLDSGVRLLVLLSHACAEVINPTIVFRGTRGVARHQTEQIEIQLKGKAPEVIQRGADSRSFIVPRFCDAVRGVDDPQLPMATLEISRPHTLLLSSASEIAAIRDLPDSEVRMIQSEQAGTITAIQEIEALFQKLC